MGWVLHKSVTDGVLHCVSCGLGGEHEPSRPPPDAYILLLLLSYAAHHWMTRQLNLISKRRRRDNQTRKRARCESLPGIRYGHAGGLSVLVSMF